MSKKKRCHYFCNGYCFWYGDTGEVCDTNNNQHDGYCPKEENDRELEEHAKAITEGMKQNESNDDRLR